MLNKQGRSIAVQAAVWSLVWFCFLLLLNKEESLTTNFWWGALKSTLGIFLVVVFNLQYLIPVYYLNKKKLHYYIISGLMLLSVAFGLHSDYMPWNSEKEVTFVDERVFESATNDNNLRWLIRNLPPLFISLLGSSFIALTAYANKKESDALNLQKSQLETELMFLKSQINPHFLFNTIHNIYALTVIQSKEAPEQLLKLSGILRYMLYDSNAEFVSLKKEIENLKNYISLAQLKDSQGLDIEFTIEVEDQNALVAPLLFIPFVENAFKHSQIEDLHKGFIRILLESVPGTLFFSVENSRPEKPYSKDNVGGIGLVNIRKRLHLLYPDKHDLQIQSGQEHYAIHLELEV